MGVVIIVTLAFGLITPPYGIALLMASKFIGVRFGRAMFASFPIYVVFLATIVVLHLLPRSRAVAAQATAARVGGLLQESERAAGTSAPDRRPPQMSKHGLLELRRLR